MAKDRVKHEGRGSGQAEGGLENRGLKSPTPRVGVRINTDGTPRGVSESSMDWAKVNHDGFHFECD
jgi:hypothetical protein